MYYASINAKQEYHENCFPFDNYPVMHKLDTEWKGQLCVLIENKDIKHLGSDNIAILFPPENLLNQFCFPLQICSCHSISTDD